MDSAGLLEVFRPLLDGALIATDFDGTLAPLTVDPQDSQALPGAVEALTALAGCGARIAVITGRDVETVLRLGGLDVIPRLTVAGLYGVETWAEHQLSTPPTPAGIENLRTQLPRMLARNDADPAIWIEDKRLSLVVHARRAVDPVAALAAIRTPLEALAEDLGFEVHPGSQVLELRLPGFDKGGTLARLVRLYRPGAVLYLGDDLGDVPAFDQLRRMRGAGANAWSVGVLGSGVEAVGRAVDVTVPDAEAAVAFLTALAALAAPTP